MNRLEKLQHDLQATTKVKVVNNVHLANITGFSRPSISEAIRSGKINTRMSRVLDLVDLVVHAYDITALWELADDKPLQTHITLAEWASSKLDKLLTPSGVLEENQLDIEDVYGRPETPDWLPLQLRDEAHKLTDAELRQVVEIGEISQQGAIGAFKELAKNSSEIDAEEKKENSKPEPKRYFGFTSPLALNMIESDIQSGHINEDFDALMSQLKTMFGEQGHYEFKQVKAALVALECPELVQKMKTSFGDDFEVFCRGIVEKYLSERIPEQDIRESIAVRIPTVINQLGLTVAPEDSWFRAMLETAIVDLSLSDMNVHKLANARILRRELSESPRLKGKLKPEEAA